MMLASAENVRKTVRIDDRMAKKPRKTEGAQHDDDSLDPAEAQRRMDAAVRRMLSTKPETHEEMVERKHRKGEIKPRNKK
jgi:hypothetical protein